MSCVNSVSRSKLLGTLMYLASGAVLSTLMISRVFAYDTAVTVHIPEISHADVGILFGHNLENASRSEHLLLLAAAMDVTAPGSLFTDQRIGVPYLVGEGAGFWAMSLATQDVDVDTLVNNALLLLFVDAAQDQMEARQSAAIELLEKASDKGYWPADVYLAEYYFEKALDVTPASPKGGNTKTAHLTSAYGHFLACAKVGFAPCQLKLGFMYLVSGTVDASIPLLQAAMDVVRFDRRYLDSPETIRDVYDALTVLTAHALHLRADERALYLAMRDEMGELR